MAKYEEKPGLAKDLRLQHWLASTMVSDDLDFMVACRPEIETASQPPPTSPTRGSLLLPGSFDPLHQGHIEMAKFAAEKIGRECWLEISVTNVDKRTLQWPALSTRLNQSFTPYGLIISNASRFSEKSTLFPGTTFVVGADTMVRFSDLKYHGNSYDVFIQAVNRIRENHCCFLIFGRKIANKFVDQENISLDDAIRPICSFVNRMEFSHDISSTRIRNQENPNINNR